MSTLLRRSRRLSSVLDAIGNTPAVRLDRIGRDVQGVEIYLKLEFANPGGSVKDRPALSMVRHALATGALSEDKILIDATSGNTGVAYSLIGAALGFRVELVMPANVTRARKDITQAFGTQLTYSSPMEGSDGAIVLVREMVKRNPEKYFYCDQYSNPENPLAHYRGTGQEILDAFGDRITHFVAGLGTSGTAMGTTRRLHEHTRKVYCMAVEPAEALHGLEGLKHMASSIQPPIFDPKVPDEILPIGTEEGWEMTERLGAEEGLHVGHSTGANVCGALKLAQRLQRERQEGCIVVIACDRGDRYFAPMKWERRYTW
jgi:S-sulfo-L-cysteine synthase (O-acetyl-L-serine-dependent)